MLQLKSIVLKLPKEDYSRFVKQLEESKAEKLKLLLKCIREDKLSDEEMTFLLEVNTSAFYSMRARLFEKTQEFLLSEIDEPRADLLKKIANINTLVYNTHKDTAIAILKKMEKELIEYDMPNDLTSVYNALKKLHLHTPKYYQYTQLYNKHVAYTIALDKAEGLLADFSKLLGEYFISRKQDSLQIMWLMKKEMANVCRLYESHHLQVYKNIVDISFALFIPLPAAFADDEPVQDILEKTGVIFETYNKDTTYHFLKKVYYFLCFEYYNSISQHKKAAQYFEDLNKDVESFLLLTHCTVPSLFLLSKINYYRSIGQEDKLDGENENLDFEPDKLDYASCINYTHYRVACFINSKKYAEAAKILNDLLNEVSFKHFPHSEIRMKLLLATSFSLLNKYDEALLVLSSVQRKIKELNEEGEYENAAVFAKMIRLQTTSESKNREKKLMGLRDEFLRLNTGRSKILESLRLDDLFIKELSKSVK